MALWDAAPGCGWAHSSPVSSMGSLPRRDTPVPQVTQTHGPEEANHPIHTAQWRARLGPHNEPTCRAKGTISPVHLHLPKAHTAELQRMACPGQAPVPLGSRASAAYRMGPQAACGVLSPEATCTSLSLSLPSSDDPHTRHLPSTDFSLARNTLCDGLHLQWHSNEGPVPGRVPTDTSVRPCPTGTHTTAAEPRAVPSSLNKSTQHHS